MKVNTAKILPYHHRVSSHSHYSQEGFTLIELLVALMIFAILAVAGWQVMDSISKSRDHANIQLAQLGALQYAYLQLSQDFAQTTNYVSVPTGLSVANKSAQNTGIKPTFSLNPQQVDFIRLASPDPRLNPPPVLARVVYVITEGKLVKQRFYQLQNPQEQPNASVLLTGVSDAKWVAFTPTMVDNFPDMETLQQAKTNHEANQPTQNTNQTNDSQNLLDLTPYQQLPKGVALSFTYNNQKVIWKFALPNQSPTFSKSSSQNAASATASSPNPNPNPSPNSNNSNYQNNNTQPSSADIGQAQRDN